MDTPSDVGTTPDAPVSCRRRAFPPAPGWAGIELLLASTIIVAGLRGYIPLGPTPALLFVAAGFVWWRGPGWRAIGLSRPANAGRIGAIGVAAGVAYHFVSLYAIEPAIARVTSGELPDVSLFRPVVGDEMQLAFWLAISWTVAAFVEELVYRGWLVTRLAELGRFSTAAWVAGVAGSAAVFGVVHLYQGASGIIATGLTGLLLACLYMATGRNLWASILAHGFADTAGFVMIYLGVYPGL